MKFSNYQDHTYKFWKGKSLLKNHNQRIYIILYYNITQSFVRIYILVVCICGGHKYETQQECKSLRVYIFNAWHIRDKWML